jgi:hypothetical protein
MHGRIHYMALVAVALALIAGGRAMAADVVSTEIRTYDILIDGKPAGQSTLSLERLTDGSEACTTDAKLTVKWAVFSYVYEFHGREEWRGGGFLQLSSRAVDGGKRLSLEAHAADGSLLVSKSGGKSAAAPLAQLTTNYWRRPAAMVNGTKLTILDADNGKSYDVRATVVGREELSTGSMSLSAEHVRLQGGVNVDLWFDVNGYLIRQTGAEDGHATELRLTSIQQRGPAQAMLRP